VVPSHLTLCPWCGTLSPACVPVVCLAPPFQPAVYLARVEGQVSWLQRESYAFPRQRLSLLRCGAVVLWCCSLAARRRQAPAPKCAPGAGTEPLVCPSALPSGGGLFSFSSPFLFLFLLLFPFLSLFLLFPPRGAGGRGGPGAEQLGVCARVHGDGEMRVGRLRCSTAARLTRGTWRYCPGTRTVLLSTLPSFWREK